MTLSPLFDISLFGISPTSYALVQSIVGLCETLSNKAKL